MDWTEIIVGGLIFIILLGILITGISIYLSYRRKLCKLGLLGKKEQRCCKSGKDCNSGGSTPTNSRK